MFKKSNNPLVAELTKTVKKRSHNLSCLRPLKLEELDDRGKNKRLCAWCYTDEIKSFHGNARYCSKACGTSAMAWAFPQKEDSLKYLLMAQDYKCAHCQFDYKPFLIEMIEKERKRFGGVWELLDLPWFYFKRLKNIVPADRKPEIDHILAISKGGISLGQENHQVLCFLDHKIKSKIDNSGPRKKN